MLLSSLLAAQLAFAAGCGGEGATPVASEAADAGPQEAPSVQPSIRDGAHDGPKGFYFLPPLVEEPAFDVTFDPDRSPTVEICELDDTGCGPVVAEFTRETGPGSETVRVDEAAEHYVVDWHTDEFDLEAGQVYRIQVLLEGREAGHADVVAVTSGKEMKNAETGDPIALEDGRSLPIKFRIEKELVLVDPAVRFPPDSFPSAIYDDSSNIIQDPACRGTPFLRSIVTVTFNEGTTPRERRAAVDLVDGEVVGGVPLSGQGIYLIQVEDDGTGSAVCAAEAALEELPTVDRAAPDDIAEAHYRRPRDGAAGSTDAPEPDPVGAHGERAQDDVVPAVAPDTVPEGFYDEDNFRTGSACTTGQMLRGIVVVTFEERTTHQEKQQAVDAVDGDVVGGIRSRDDIEGFYYVRVEDDPDGQVLCEAVETLNDLPQVGNATPSLTTRSFCRRPDDGGDWREDAREPTPVPAHGERTQDDIVPVRPPGRSSPGPF